MLKTLILAAVAVASVYAKGEFIVLQRPESIEFRGNEPLNQSMLKDLILAMLGFTIQPHQSWNGLTIKDPFSLPEAVLSIAIEDVNTLPMSRGVKFPLNVDESEEGTWQVVRRRLEDRDKNNTLIRISVGDGFDALGQSSLGELKLNDIERPPEYLNAQNETDAQFIREVQLLRAIAQKVPSTIIPNSKPDVYWLIVSGIGPVMDSHGENSLAVKEAFKLLNDALEEIRQAFTEVYRNKVAIVAFTNNLNEVRDTRSIHPLRIRRLAEANETDIASEETNKASDAAIKIKSKAMDEDDVKIVNDGESSNNETSENVDIITEPNYIIESTEPLGHELNHLTHEIHSMTDGENTDKPVKLEDINLATKYSKDYPAIFNIILWFGVIFVFSLLAICITIMDMDPGRDSVIYRMTSNRMKKDN